MRSPGSSSETRPGAAPREGAAGLPYRRPDSTKSHPSSAGHELQHDLRKLLRRLVEHPVAGTGYDGGPGAGNLRRQRAQHAGSAPGVSALSMNKVGVRSDWVSLLP